MTAASRDASTEWWGSARFMSAKNGLDVAALPKQLVSMRLFWQPVTIALFVSGYGGYCLCRSNLSGYVADDFSEASFSEDGSWNRTAQACINRVPRGFDIRPIRICKREHR